MALNLGTYEMVLALSEKTINALFKDLKEDGKIHDVWSIRRIYDNDDRLVETVINEGYKPDSDPEYKTVKARFDAAFEEAVRAKTKMEGFIANVGDPFISIKAKKYFEVDFKVPFTLGEMAQYSGRGSNILTQSLDEISYVFEVELAKISYPYPAAPIQDPATAETVRNRVDETAVTLSLTPEDFTIEKLFLNFENARFIAATAGTDNPEDLDLTKWAEFQILLQGYFKGAFAESKNPYVLGYGVTMPKLDPRAAAVFQPASLAFSTSFVAAADNKADPGRCSLNYLMMLTKANSASEVDQGIMNSLIDKYDVLGIGYDLFYANCLKAVFDVVAVELNATIISLNKSHSDVAKQWYSPARSSADYQISATGKFNADRDPNDQLRCNFGSAATVVADYFSSTSNTKTSASQDYKKTIHPSPWARIEFPEYLVTKASLDVLEHQGMPNTIRKRLDSLEGIPFRSEAELCASLGALAVDQMDRYKASILVATKEAGMVIDLRFQETIDYCHAYTMVAFKAKTRQDGAGLYITIYPGAKGALLANVIPHDAQETLTEGTWGTVDEVNDCVTGGFYAGLNQPEFLKKLADTLEKSLKGLSAKHPVVLPISNVYVYKAIEFIADNRDSKNSVITFQSTYLPQPPAPHAAEGRHD